MGRSPGKEGQIEELVGSQNPGPEAPSRSKKRPERREQRRCEEWNDCQWSYVEGWVCQGLEGEEVGGDDPGEYFFSMGIGSPS